VVRAGEHPARRRRHADRRPAPTRHPARRAAHGHAPPGRVAPRGGASARWRRPGVGRQRYRRCGQPLRAHRRGGCPARPLQGVHDLMVDVAIVSFAQCPSVRIAERPEVQLIVPVVAEAVARSGIPRSEIGFTCSGSADYLSGAPFAFVGNLEATGAWPPIRESHVELDGAWALYEAWVRLQHGDIDSALVFASGKSSPAVLPEVLALQLDPDYLMPLWVDSISMAA